MTAEILTLHKPALPRFEDVPEPTPEEMAEHEAGALASAIEWRARTEAEAPANRRIVWLDAAPEWGCGSWFHLSMLAEAAAEARGMKHRRARYRCAFTLPSGGDLTVTVHREPRTWDGKVHMIDRLEFSAITPSGLVRGALDTTATEMDSTFLTVPESAPAAIVAEIADTLRRIDSPEALLALRKPGGRCCVCHRPLRDQVSRVLEIGPDCADHAGILHNAETVARVLKLREARR